MADKTLKVSEVDQAYSILKDYNGSNGYIRMLQRKYSSGGLILDEFSINYILNNFDYEPINVEKIVKLTPEGGQKIKDKYDLDFTPDRVKITRIIGEMGNSYHCYAQYRKSVPPTLMYINKNNILNDVHTVNPNDIEVDFDKYDEKTKHLNRKLKTHQREGIKFLLANKKCILADSMGTGKTSQLVVSALESGVKKILVICPASLKSTWKKEICYYDDEENITVLKSSDWQDSKRWWVVNYDILANFYTVPMEQAFTSVKMERPNGTYEVLRIPETKKSKGQDVPKMKKSTKKALIKECMDKSPLYQEGFDCVIIDEAHKLSNNSSMRYKILDDFLKRTKPQYVFLTTGTPLTNKPINLYWILKLLDADITKDYKYYINRYCDARTFKLRTGKEVTTTGGATNLTELREKIKHLYIRRLMSDVSDLVDKNVITKAYDLTPQQEERYHQLWDEYMEAQREQGEPDNEEYRQLVEGIILRQYLANEMIEHTIDVVDNLLEEGEKVVIICTFQEEMQKFKAYYKDKVVLFNGTMTNKQKDRAVERFMNEEEVRVFVGQVEAMVGITLTCAHNLIFNSFSWISASNSQAEDRIYRITQDRDVNCIYQIFNDELSEHMYDIVQNKAYMAQTVIQTEDRK